MSISNYTQVELNRCMVDVEAEEGVSNFYCTQFGEAGRKRVQEKDAGMHGPQVVAPARPLRSEDELEEAGYTGDRWDSFFTRLRFGSHPRRPPNPS